MSLSYRSIAFSFTFFLTVFANAQIPSVDYFPSIKNYDLSKLWQADSIQIEGDGDNIPFPEPLGYIGDNFQRFYIHYISVTRSKNDPYQYNVYGKTMVRENICSF